MARDFSVSEHSGHGLKNDGAIRGSFASGVFLTESVMELLSRSIL